MSEKINERDRQFNETLDRFSMLNATGRHHFIGRIIESARGKLLLKQEIERALLRLETDFHLGKCWERSDATLAESALVLQAEF